MYKKLFQSFAEAVVISFGIVGTMKLLHNPTTTINIPETIYFKKMVLDEKNP